MNLQHSEIQKYLKALNKGKYFFIILSLSIMSVIIWGSYFLPKKYEAKSTIFIESNVINNLVKGIAVSPSMEDRIRVLRYAILSRGLVSKVLTDLDVDIKDQKKFEEKILAYQKYTQISVKENELFIVSITDPDPKFAMNYINTLVRRYVEENVSGKREEAYGANRFLSDQVAQFKGKLDKADEKIINFRKEKGIYMAVDEVSVIQDIKQLKTEIDNINVMRNQLMATKNITQTQLKNEEPMTVAFSRHSGSDNATITALENKMKQLLVRYTENYPEVIRIKAEIEALKKQAEAKPPGAPSGDTTEPEMSTMNPVYQQLKQTFLQTEAEIEALDSRKKQLSALIGRKETELRNIPEGKKILADLEKERDGHKNIYEQLLVRVGQSEVSKEMEIGDKATTFRIVDPAVLPMKPVSPQRVKLIFIGIFLGILGGVGGVVARENFSPSVNSVKTLRNLGIEVLAVIPKIFNEEEQQIKAKKDKLVFSIAGSYLCLIGLLLVHELMGLTYIDSFFNLFRL
jgi:polysaccharide chain length determinant protein (PEP-CTERM system associated)